MRTLHATGFAAVLAATTWPGERTGGLVMFSPITRGRPRVAVSGDYQSRSGTKTALKILSTFFAVTR